MLAQLRDFNESERGNTLLTSLDSMDFNAYIALPGGGYLEITFRAANYPALNVSTLDIVEEELVKHINSKLGGMFVTRGNLVGLNMDKTDCIKRLIKDYYDDGVCPDCGEPIPDDAEDGSDCVNCGHVFGYYEPAD